MCTIISRYPEAAILLSYATIKETLRQWRARVFPSPPVSITDFDHKLSVLREGMMGYHGGTLSYQMVTDTDGCSHLLFMDTDFLRRNTNDLTKLFVDATYGPTPRLDDATQLLTLLGVFFNHVSNNFLIYAYNRFIYYFYYVIVFSEFASCIRSDVAQNKSSVSQPIEPFK